MKDKLISCQYRFAKKGTAIFIRIDDLRNNKSKFKDDDFERVEDTFNILQTADKGFVWFVGKLKNQTIEVLFSYCFTKKNPSKSTALEYLNHPLHENFL